MKIFKSLGLSRADRKRLAETWGEWRAQRAALGAEFCATLTRLGRALDLSKGCMRCSCGNAIGQGTRVYGDVGEGNGHGAVIRYYNSKWPKLHYRGFTF
jgi:hypothetical protein